MVSGNHFGVLDTDAIKQGLKSTEAFHGMQNTPADSIMLSLSFRELQMEQIETQFLLC